MDEDRDGLIERVASAHRHRHPDGQITPSPAFFDLDTDGRQEAFERALLNRKMEAALDPEGLSSTARAVLSRIQKSLAP